MAQDLAVVIPRVRRAVEGPVPLADGAPGRLTDDQVVAMAADAVADIILLTNGRWGHTLIRDVSSADPPVETWEVDPNLTEPEERLIALQSALGYTLYKYSDAVTSESIQSEGQSWETQRSATTITQQIKSATEARDAALAAAVAENPVLAQYASLLAARDPVGYRLIEPWRRFAPGGFETPSIAVGGQDVYLP